MPHQVGHITEEMKRCMRSCLDCFASCEQTAAHCLSKGGAHANPQHVALLLDCADICEASAAFLARGTERHKRTCSLCAEICRSCGESCAQFKDDAQMKACADVCRACAESCQKMAA